MALVIKDRVKESSTTTGTGAYTLAGAEGGFQTFAAIGDGNTTFYTATDGTNWEVGIGTYTASGTTLARTTIISSSNSNAAVNWGAGEKLLFCTQPASKAIFNDADDKVVNADHFTGKITFDAIDHPAHAEGQVYYDTHHHTLSYQSDISGFEHEIGIEEHVRVYNNSGSTIAKGKPVYWSGNSNDVPTIGLGNATSAAKYNVQGLTAHDIANNSFGYVITSGLVDGIDTSSLNAGDNFFVGLTDGAVQNASPTYPNFPMCLGWVVKSNASTGIVLVNQQNHSVNTFRVKGDAHIGNDLIISGDLTVQGTQTSTSSENVQLGASFQYLNSGDTIGDVNTGFTGTGLDDAYFVGHYTGTATKTFYVRIDDDQNTPDTFEWSYNSDFSTLQGQDIEISVGNNFLADGISIYFASDNQHSLGDVWSGTASPANVDTGFFTNYNTGSSGVGYTHTGLFWDASASKWVVLSEYSPEPEGTINLAHASVAYATFKVGTLEGNVTGDLTGDVTGDVTGNVAGNVTGNLTGNVTGDVTGDVTGALTGNVSGNVTGNLTGDVTGSVTDSGTSSFDTVQLGDWTITEDVNGKLAFSHNGTVKATLSDDGTFAAANDIFTDETL